SWHAPHAAGWRPAEPSSILERPCPPHSAASSEPRSNVSIMRLALGILAFIAGIALGSLAVHVAVFGAEQPLPPEDEAIEGRLAAGDTVESPVGRPFLYGEVKVTEQRGQRLGVDE